MNDFQDILRLIVEARSDVPGLRTTTQLAGDAAGPVGDDDVEADVPLTHADPRTFARAGVGRGVSDGGFLAPQGAGGGEETTKRRFQGKSIPDDWGKPAKDAERLGSLGGAIGAIDDPMEALQAWATAHTQEWNALKSRAYMAVRLLEQVYTILPGYSETDKPTVAPARDFEAERAALRGQVAAMDTQLPARRRPSQASIQPTMDANALRMAGAGGPGGTTGGTH
jgi:hypothetical protein